MKPLRVRAYNIEFGDAILVSIPETIQNNEEKYRHILIDIGNRGTENDNRLFEPVMKDILEQLNGDRIDLYVMTHEHLDHVQGLPFAEKNLYKESDDELYNKLNIRYAWFPVSSKPNYFDEPGHAMAKQKFQEIRAALVEIGTYLEALEAIGEPINQTLQTLWAINNIGITKDCVDYLKTFNQKSYMHRGLSTVGHHHFSEANLEIWAPEEDVATYFSAFSPQTMNLKEITNSEEIDKTAEYLPLIPPPGVDAGAFYDLVVSRRRFYENLLAANTSKNNTSIVFCLEWHGNRLLFTGDAEELSWKIMEQNGVLKEVNFLKISHHGSENGTPETEILKKILPKENKDEHVALLSTAVGPYDTIPDEATLQLIEERCKRVYRLHTEVEPGGHQDIYFQAK